MSSGWEIEVLPNHNCDLSFDRRIVQYDCNDIEEALTIVRRRDGRDTEVTLVEPDGYRTKLRA